MSYPKSSKNGTLVAMDNRNQSLIRYASRAKIDMLQAKYMQINIPERKKNVIKKDKMIRANEPQNISTNVADIQ